MLRMAIRRREKRIQNATTHKGVKFKFRALLVEICQD